MIISANIFAKTKLLILSVETLKGTVSRDGYFFNGLNILIGTFCVCADGFQGLSKAFNCL